MFSISLGPNYGSRIPQEPLQKRDGARAVAVNGLGANRRVQPWRDRWWVLLENIMNMLSILPSGKLS